MPELKKLQSMNYFFNQDTSFQDALILKQALVLLDIAKDQIDTITQAITKHHPQAKFEGIEPLIPPPY